MSELRAIRLEDNKISLIDQRQLPHKEVWLSITDLAQLEEAIKTLAIRGAPALGVAAALGLSLTVFNAEEGISGPELYSELCRTAERIKKTRPTAVNLFWATDRIMSRVKEAKDDPEAMSRTVLSITKAIMEEEEEFCSRISDFGAELIPEKAGILTHCNTGALATGGSGTALGVIKKADQQKKDIFVWVDETRPLLQGARLTTWELCRAEIPFNLVTDNMAGFLMQQQKVDLVIVGADRIAANGDAANKIGTYSLGVLADFHKIPFYIAAPYTTIDFSLKSGKEIPIEQRKEEEVLGFSGRPCAPKEAAAFNPAFDVTPSELITAIVTEKGVIHPPYRENLKKAQVK